MDGFRCNYTAGTLADQLTIEQGLFCRTQHSLLRRSIMKKGCRTWGYLRFQKTWWSQVPSLKGILAQRNHGACELSHAEPAKNGIYSAEGESLAAYQPDCSQEQQEFLARQTSERIVVPNCGS